MSLTTLTIVVWMCMLWLDASYLASHSLVGKQDWSNDKAFCLPRPRQQLILKISHLDHIYNSRVAWTKDGGNPSDDVKLRHSPRHLWSGTTWTEIIQYQTQSFLTLKGRCPEKIALPFSQRVRLPPFHLRRGARPGQNPTSTWPIFRWTIQKQSTTFIRMIEMLSIWASQLPWRKWWRLKRRSTPPALCSFYRFFIFLRGELLRLVPWPVGGCQNKVM